MDKHNPFLLLYGRVVGENRLQGYVYGNPKFENNTLVTTSPVVNSYNVTILNEKIVYETASGHFYQIVS